MTTTAKLTIHTATYNRAYIIGKAYESLKAQTNKSFEWIITDDGSTDNTEELVKKWINETDSFPIIYNKLDHVGIPRALNSGIQHANTDWFMMLDSDDAIQPETVELVLGWLDEIKDNASFAGVGFAKCDPSGKYMKDQIPVIDEAVGYVDATNIERKKYNLDMDMCEVHRTQLFKKYPFQIWKGEKYAPEQLNYNQIALAGKKIRWRNSKLYVCDYLPDGQTRDNSLVKRNPMGFAMMYNQNALLAKTIRGKLRNTIQMEALAIYGGHPEYLLQSNCKWLAFLTLPVSYLLYLRRKRQFSVIK